MPPSTDSQSPISWNLSWPCDLIVEWNVARVMLCPFWGQPLRDLAESAPQETGYRKSIYMAGERGPARGPAGKRLSQLWSSYLGQIQLSWFPVQGSVYNTCYYWSPCQRTCWSHGWFKSTHWDFMSLETLRNLNSVQSRLIIAVFIYSSNFFH